MTSNTDDDKLYALACLGSELVHYRRPRCRWRPGLLQEGPHWQRTEEILFGTTPGYTGVEDAA